MKLEVNGFVRVTGLIDGLAGHASDIECGTISRWVKQACFLVLVNSTALLYAVLYTFVWWLLCQMPVCIRSPPGEIYKLIKR